MHLQKIESWLIDNFSVEWAYHAEAPPTSSPPPHYLPPSTISPAKLARAAVPATPALPALPGLPGAVPRRLGAVWLTGPGDPGDAKKAVPAAPSKAAPTTVCAIASKIFQAKQRANVRLSQVPPNQFIILLIFLPCKDMQSHAKTTVEEVEIMQTHAKSGLRVQQTARV